MAAAGKRRQKITLCFGIAILVAILQSRSTAAIYFIIASRFAVLIGVAILFSFLIFFGFRLLQFFAAFDEGIVNVFRNFLLFVISGLRTFNE